MIANEKEVPLHEGLARNIRVLMNLHDCDLSHMLVVLKGEKLQVRDKINGKRAFAASDLELLAEYFNTTVQGLYGDIEKAPPPKYQKNGQEKGKIDVGVPLEIIEAEVEQQNGADSLVEITENTSELAELVKKTFLAKLSGKIEDLGYYVRNNIMMRALRQSKNENYCFVLTEEEKNKYITHFVAQYEVWKDGLVNDIDDVMEVSLASNELEVVLAALCASGKTRLTQFITYQVKDATNEEKVVDIAQLAEGLGKAMDQLKKGIKLLEDYLHR